MENVGWLPNGLTDKEEDADPEGHSGRRSFGRSFSEAPDPAAGIGYDNGGADVTAPSKIEPRCGPGGLASLRAAETSLFTPTSILRALRASVRGLFGDEIKEEHEDDGVRFEIAIGIDKARDKARDEGSNASFFGRKHPYQRNSVIKPGWGMTTAVRM